MQQHLHHYQRQPADLSFAPDIPPLQNHANLGCWNTAPFRRPQFPGIRHQHLQRPFPPPAAGTALQCHRRQLPPGAAGLWGVGFAQNFTLLSRKCGLDVCAAKIYAQIQHMPFLLPCFYSLSGHVGAQQNILCIVAKLEFKFSGFYPPYIIRDQGYAALWSDSRSTRRLSPGASVRRRKVASWRSGFTTEL